MNIPFYKPDVKSAFQRRTQTSGAGIDHSLFNFLNFVLKYLIFCKKNIPPSDIIFQQTITPSYSRHIFDTIINPPEKSKIFASPVVHFNTCTVLRNRPVIPPLTDDGKDKNHQQKFKFHTAYSGSRCSSKLLENAQVNHKLHQIRMAGGSSTITFS